MNNLAFMLKTGDGVVVNKEARGKEIADESKSDDTSYTNQVNISFLFNS